MWFVKLLSQYLNRIRKSYHLVFLGLFVACLSLLHVAIANIPNTFVFDEVVYVPEAVAILNKGWISTYHPPLAKMLIAASIWTFGNNGLGWRFASIVFGICSVLVLYLTVKKAGNRSVALLSAILFGLDNLVFVQSSIATLDIFFVFFMILGFYFYFRNQYSASSLSIALSCLSKVTGLLSIPIVLIHFFLTHKHSRLKFAFRYLATFLAPFLVLLFFLDYTVGTNLNPLDHLRELLLLTPATRTGTDRPMLTIESAPWTWITNPQAIPYYVVPSSPGGTISPISYLGIGNPLIWLLTIPVMVSMVYLYAKKRDSLCLFSILWFAFTYLLPWYPAFSIAHRAMYIYYFLPTVGSVCIAISIMLNQIPRVMFRGHLVELGKYAQVAYAFAVLNLFLVYFPVKSFGI